MEGLDPLTWSVLLMVAGCALAISEVFIPSGGILGILSFVSVLTSIALAFYHNGPASGFIFSLVAVVALPIGLGLALKYWPQTALGRKFVPPLPTDEEVLPDGERRRALKQLVGRVGTARTPMLPAGAIRIDGQTIDAVSQGMAIEAGQQVEVVEVHGFRVVVRAARPGKRSALGRQEADDLLSQPIDQLGLDPLDDPLG